MGNETLKSFLKGVRHSQSAIKSILLVLLILVLGSAVTYVALHRNSLLSDVGNDVKVTEQDILKQLDEGNQATPSADLKAPTKVLPKRGYVAPKKPGKVVARLNKKKIVYSSKPKVVKAKAKVSKKVAMKKPSTVSSSKYVVVKGDSLWKISAKKYSTGKKWPVIYKNNKKTIGKNPNLIYPKQVLYIPHLKTKGR